jgi:hypothetical protein
MSEYQRDGQETAKRHKCCTLKNGRESSGWIGGASGSLKWLVERVGVKSGC